MKINILDHMFGRKDDLPKRVERLEDMGRKEGLLGQMVERITALETENAAHVINTASMISRAEERVDALVRENAQLRDRLDALEKRLTHLEHNPLSIAVGDMEREEQEQLTGPSSPKHVGG